MNFPTESWGPQPSLDVEKKLNLSLFLHPPNNLAKGNLTSCSYSRKEKRPASAKSLSTVFTPGTRLDRYASRVGVYTASTSGLRNFWHMVLRSNADSGLCKFPKNEASCSLACQREAELMPCSSSLLASKLHHPCSGFSSTLMTSKECSIPVFGLIDAGV